MSAEHATLYIIGLLSLALLYGLYVILKGWLLVRNAPRADMFMCPKGHGPIPTTALIKFMGEDFCPICFHSKLKDAEQGRIK